MSKTKKLSLDDIVKEVTMAASTKKTPRSTKNKATKLRKLSDKQQEQDAVDIVIADLSKKEKNKQEKKKEKESMKALTAQHLAQKATQIDSDSDQDQQTRKLFQQSISSDPKSEDEASPSEKEEVAQIPQKSNLAPRKKDSQNKSRKVTFNEEVKVKIVQPEVYHDPDRKWNVPIKDEIRGRFSPEEERILVESMCKYCVNNDIQITELCQMLSDNTKPQRVKKMWTLICSVLPRRTLHSCLKFIKRRFDPRNYKGKWTKQQEEKLVELVDQHGRKWAKLSKILGRTPQNLRDKFDFMERGEDHIPFWSITEILTLLKSIESETRDKFLSKNTHKLIQTSEQHDEIDLKERANRKNISKNFVFHNIKAIIEHIDYNIVKQQNFSNINWREIAKLIGTKNKDDCRAMWTRIMILEQLSSNPFSYKHDLQLVESIESQEPDNQTEVNFNVENGRTEEQNKQRWRVLKRFVCGRLSKSLQDVVVQIQEKLKKNHAAYKQKQAALKEKQLKHSKEQKTDEAIRIEKIRQELTERMNPT